MTALTTILSMSTMALGLGDGSEMMQPMAIVTEGGLIYGTLLTLFVVPCIYDAFNREKKYGGGRIIMNGRYENGALPEKVRLLYEAVLAMVTNGWDINRMKVSDITAQAGIGKGTAYEYFSSKEEIIANAVLYDVEMRLAHVLEITKGEGDFAGKFVQILTYMEEVFAKRQGVLSSGTDRNWFV